MTVLGSEWIHTNATTLGIYPENIQPASVDLCLDESSTGFEVSNGHLCIPAGVHGLLATKEVVTLPTNVCAQIVLKSSIARRGLVMGAGHVDPGFRGQLTVCVMTANRAVKLELGKPFCQLRFYEVADNTRPYSGNYLDSVGAVADKTS